MDSKGTAPIAPPVLAAGESGFRSATRMGAPPPLSANIVSNIVAGTLAALVTLSYSVSYGALIFNGKDLDAYLHTGLHAALMSAWVVALIVTLGSSFHFAIAGPDSNATAILAMIAAAMVQQLNDAGVPNAEIAASVLAMLAITAVFTGLVVFGIGALRRGKLVRFLPYPVVGGFLGGTGYLIFAGGFKVFTGHALTFEILKSFPHVPAVSWAVTGGVTLALLTIPRYVKHYLVMPIVIIAGVIAFYAGLKISGMDIAAARELGLMFKPLASGGSVHNVYDAVAIVRWDVLVSQWQNFLAMNVVVIVTILLNATGIELATHSDVNFDRELRANGIANMVSGLCGGMIGYLSISRSMLNYKAGASSRMAGIVTALVCLGATFLFSPLLSYFPRPVLAGILIFLGLSMLREWVWDAYFKLPLLEYELIGAILVLIAAYGLITGVAFGLLVASVFFVYSCSRANCVKHSVSSDTHFSNKERSLEQLQTLKNVGHCSRALALQGYIFFGTSSVIVETCRDLIEHNKIKYLLLDFRLVQGVDASAVLSFEKLLQLCKRGGTRLMLSNVREEALNVFEQTKFLPNKKIRIFSDMDRGLEWTEDRLLGVTPAAVIAEEEDTPDSRMIKAITAEMDLRRILSNHFDPVSLNVLIGYCQTTALAKDEPLFKRGDPSDALYFVERGDVSVLLRLSDGQLKRLRTFGPGTIVGEMGLFSKQPRSADVVAESECRVRKLTGADLERLEVEHPMVAVQFHTFVIKLLASRVNAANEEIKALI